MRTLIAFTFIALLAGCATVPHPEAAQQPRRVAAPVKHRAAATAPAAAPAPAPVVPAAPAKPRFRIRWFH